MATRVWNIYKFLVWVALHLDLLLQGRYHLAFLAGLLGEPSHLGFILQR